MTKRTLRDPRGSTFALLVAASLLAHLPLVGQEVDGQPARRVLPNYNALSQQSAQESVVGSKLKVVAALETSGMLRQGSNISLEERLGVPNFIWAGNAESNQGAVQSKTPLFTMKIVPFEKAESVARGHLNRFAELYGLSESDVVAAPLAHTHDTGEGAIVVKMRQQIGGIDVFRDEVNVIMNRNYDLLAISGYIPGSSLGTDGTSTKIKNFQGDASIKTAAPSGFKLSPQEAISRAFLDLTEAPLDTESLALHTTSGGYSLYKLRDEATANLGFELKIPARIKPVLFHLADGLQAAYYVELDTTNQATGESDYFGYVISAADGSLLFRNNLRADVVPSSPFTYRVWVDGANKPLPGPHNPAFYLPSITGVPDGFMPPYLGTSLVTLQNGPISTNDPWLPLGATETVGNNVDAYVDLVSPTGRNGSDFRAPISSASTFDYTFIPTAAPNTLTQRQAAITQLFYTNNFLHDWFYDFGFNEAAGNAQTNNYGRGGVQGDPILAEAQDYSGTNNANMSTPADGGSPRMQMYVFSGFSSKSLTLSDATSYTTGTAAFGPQSFNVTANVAYASPAIGGPAPLADLTGKIALIDRGTYSFDVKTLNAQTAGAVGVIIANTAAGVINMGAGSPPQVGITIPTLSISQADGLLLKAKITAGTIGATLARVTEVSLDGAIDGQVVTHEWGHYLSNRLIGNGSGLTTNQARGMGEGWSDFISQILTAKAGDNMDGTFSTGGYATQGLSGRNSYYFGIRRVPYSIDFTKNALTFKHITDGVALPATNAINPAPIFGTNAEVHATGEVWATMLWEGYAALLKDPRFTFTQAQDRMKRYIVASYKATPLDPTFIEARNALLAVAYASDPADGLLFFKAFARRGLGVGAVAPARTSTNNSGVVESFVVGGGLSFGSATLTDAPANCHLDGEITNGEMGILTVRLNNVGATPLSATTATVTSTNPHVTFPYGHTMTFPSSAALTGTTTSTLTIGLTGAVGIETADISIAYNDPGLVVPGPLTSVASFLVNERSILASSATDDVESPISTWTAVGQGPDGSKWTRTAASLTSHYWHGPDLDAHSDLTLVSPVLNVSPSVPFSMTFRHAYTFEYGGGYNWDGGVIEVSPNGGPWVDISTLGGAPGYNGTLIAGGDNPLNGRSAYANTSAGYPALASQTINLGTALAGQTMQVRFRCGSDINTGAAGWDIDDIAFSGITNTPFATVAAGLPCTAQTITFPAIPTHQYGDAPFNPGATSSAGLPITYSVVSGPATVLGNIVTLTSWGTVTIRASQPGNGSYNAATSVDRTFLVQRYDLSFLDDSNRMRICINSKTGAWQATTMIIPGAATYSGQVAPTTQNGSFVLYNTTASGPRLNGYYNPATHVANFMLGNIGTTSVTLLDTNTTGQAGNCGN